MGQSSEFALSTLTHMYAYKIIEIRPVFGFLLHPVKKLHSVVLSVPAVLPPCAFKKGQPGCVCAGSGQCCLQCGAAS